MIDSDEEGPPAKKSKGSGSAVVRKAAAPSRPAGGAATAQGSARVVANLAPPPSSATVPTTRPQPQRSATSAVVASVPQSASNASANANAAPAGKGRPPLNIEALVDQLWDAIAVAEEGSVFFGPKAVSQQRSLQRYILQAGQRALQEKSEERLVELEMAKKKLMLMDSLVRIWMAWQKRKNMDSGVASFLQSWNAMVQFSQLSDGKQQAVSVRCGFMCDLRLQVLAMGDPTVLVTALASDVLAEQFGVEPTSRDICTLQEKYLKQGFVQLLTASKSQAECAAGMAALCQTVGAMEEGKIAAEVVEEVANLRTLLEPPLHQFDSSEAARVHTVVERATTMAPGPGGQRKTCIDT